MARQPRNFEIGGIYHIVNRGVGKQDIFQKPQDYNRFTLGLEFCNSVQPTDLWTTIVGSDPTMAGKRIKERRKKDAGRIVEILAFVLMPNHYHLLVREIVEGGISKFMQKMGGYTLYFNQQYDRPGPLFQSRYKSVRIKDNRQLGVVYNYIHTNPVELIEPGWKEMRVQNKEKTIQWLKNYRWSSYPDYIGNKNFPDVTKRDFFLEFWGDDCQKSVEEWISFKAESAKFDSSIILE